MEEEKISIIIPMYNSEKTIMKCLESVCSQTFYNLEIIVIDDGSDDQSYNLVKDLCLEDSRIILHKQENQGVSAARNNAIDYVTGDFLLFLDSDDWVDNMWCEKLYRKIIDTKSDMAVCNFFSMGINGKKINKKRLKARYSQAQYFAKLKKAPWLHYFGVLWNKIYKVSIIKTNHILFDKTTEFGEDFIFNLEYLKYAKKIYAINQALYYYVENNGDSLSKKRRGIVKQIDERVYLYRKYVDLSKCIKLYKTYKFEIHRYAMFFYKQIDRKLNLLQFDCVDGYITTEKKKSIEQYLKDNLLNNAEITSMEYKLYSKLYNIKQLVRYLKLDILFYGKKGGIYKWIIYLLLCIKSCSTYNLLIFYKDQKMKEALSDIFEQLLTGNQSKKIKIRLIDINNNSEIYKTSFLYNLIVMYDINNNEIKERYKNSNILIIQNSYSLQENMVSRKPINKFYEKQEIIVLNSVDKVEFINSKGNNFREKAYYIKNVFSNEGKKQLINLAKLMLEV